MKQNNLEYVDLVGDIITYENGEMTETETLEFFSKLIKSGTINNLQGHYHRVARALIRANLLTMGGTIIKRFR